MESMENRVWMQDSTSWSENNLLAFIIHNVAWGLCRYYIWKNSENLRVSGCLASPNLCYKRIFPIDAYINCENFIVK